MNKVKQAIQTKGSKILNIYITASYPNLDSTIELIKVLDKNAVDLIEVGIPNSDPLADGETIQNSSEVALKNGFKLNILFEQLMSIKNEINTPILLMGYYNQMLQFGVERFLEQCHMIGVDTLIIPDLPMNIYQKEYMDLFQKYGIGMCFLITPNTKEDRIRKADELTDGFIYVVSKTSITGKTSSIQQDQISYFKKIKSMNLNNPTLIGFGIHNKETFEEACKHADGAIIGSAFIKELSYESNAESVTSAFINKII